MGWFNYGILLNLQIPDTFRDEEMCVDQAFMFYGKDHFVFHSADADACAVPIRFDEIRTLSRSSCLRKSGDRVFCLNIAVAHGDVDDGAHPKMLKIGGFDAVALETLKDTIVSCNPKVHLYWSERNLGF